ncbi:MAG: hypothetical protein ACT4O0_13600 [Pseudonocardia sp.]|jgi:hypothetical protein
MDAAGGGTGEMSSESTSVVMAGFIVWLASRRVPRAQRYVAHAEIERFLRWCDSAPERTLDGRRDAAWCYLAELRGGGAGAAELRVTWAALELLTTFEESRGRGLAEPLR